MTPPRLMCPDTLTPAHRLTWCALNGAAELADLLSPVTPAQHEAQRRILDAAQSGDLVATYQVVNQLRKARHIGTAVWRKEWAMAWLEKVRTHIFAEVRAANAA